MHENTPSVAAGWQQLVTDATGCAEPQQLDTIQSLWSGFGAIFRVAANHKTLIVKHVNPPLEGNHPRGWKSDFATDRKLKSYAVETYWYEHLSSRCDDACRVADFLGARQHGLQRWLLLEDLDAAGFALRFQALDISQAMVCLDWLAHFHARFIDTNTGHLWHTGSYWHLETRPDEFKAMSDGPLKHHASEIDRILNHCHYQTLIHGDAKVANFCFSEHDTVAAVDFQYTGGGCGMKDVAYFIGSCFSEDECSDYADELLDRYFATLATALQKDNAAVDAKQLEQEWRALYPLAWTDFYRFLDGWMPSHKKIHRYTKALAEQTFDALPAFQQEG
jgi:hypothetical protein